MNAVLQTAFADPVHDAQQCFRAALAALSRPARVQSVGAAMGGVALGAAMAQLLLTLTDEDTLVWWQHHDAALARWLRFHTGAPSTSEPTEAAFAIVQEPGALDRLDVFAPGRPAAPEHSCTLLIEVPALTGGVAMRAHGPGIQDSQAVAIDGLHPAFWPQWQSNHASFPQGVDAFLTCGAAFMGLPRTTRIGRLEGV